MVDRILEVALGNAAAATLMALVVLAGVRALRRPAVSHLLWSAVLLRLLMPPVLELPLLPSSPQEPVAAVGLVAATGLPAGQATVTGRASPGASLRDVAVLGWFLGAVVVLALATTRISRLDRLVAGGEAAPSALQRRVEELARRMGLRRAPATTVVGARVSPLVWSPFRPPTLVLPRTLLARLESRECDTLIAHELAHVRRRDHLVRYLELTTAVLFWWHPLAWWVGRQLRAAEEQCCDALVARALPGHQRAYADCLVKTLRFVASGGVRLHPVSSGLGELHRVRERITMIMRTTAPRSLPACALGLVLLVSLVALCLSPTLACRSEEETPGRAGGEPITLNLADAELRHVLAVFSEVAEVEIAVDARAERSGLLDARVSLAAADTPWDEVLERVLQDHGLASTRRDGILWVHLPGDGEDDRGPLSGAPLAQPAPPQLEPVAAQEAELPRFVLGGKITEPVKRTTVMPVYPESLRQQEIEGVVVLDTVITAEGRVVDLKVLNDTHPEFAESAEAAVRQWVFEPATLEGEPVAVRYILTARFSLD